MSQITLYLDPDTEEKLARAAQDAGLSRSRWVANLIREKTAREWPDSVRQLLGVWRDFPEAAELRAGEGEDLPREPF
jgi:hypothetical protein